MRTWSRLFSKALLTVSLLPTETTGISLASFAGAGMRLSRSRIHPAGVISPFPYRAYSATRPQSPFGRTPPWPRSKCVGGKLRFFPRASCCTSNKLTNRSVFLQYSINRPVGQYLRPRAAKKLCQKFINLSPAGSCFLSMPTK